MRKAPPADVELPARMMAEFYAEADYPLNADRACEAFHALLTDPGLGEVWLIQTDGRDAGYMVVTLGSGMPARSAPPAACGRFTSRSRGTTGWRNGCITGPGS